MHLGLLNQKTSQRLFGMAGSKQSFFGFNQLCQNIKYVNTQAAKNVQNLVNHLSSEDIGVGKSNDVEATLTTQTLGMSETCD